MATDASSKEEKSLLPSFSFFKRRSSAPPQPQAHSNGTQVEEPQVSQDTTTKEKNANNAKSGSAADEDNGNTKSGSPAAMAWLSKAGSSIKYTFISKETEEAFAEIGVLFDKLFVDFPYNKVDLMFGLMMVDDYYRNAPVLSESPVDDINFVETARYYMKFAYCCYGWKFIYGILNRKTQKFITSMVGDAANIKALFDCTQVESKDVLVARWTSTVYDPGHYICHCREKKTIVVAFRGSFHIRDALTDLVASSTPFLHGTAHTGILHTAKKKYQALAPIVVKAWEENRDCKIVVVGHSLGAGTAALFALLFHEAHPEIPIHCYSYAPPCVVSPNIALDSSTFSLIDSIVIGDDIVPRLSFDTLNHLKHIIMEILAQRNNTFQRAFQWMSGKGKPGNITIKNISVSDISLLPPGKVSHVIPVGFYEEELDGADLPRGIEVRRKSASDGITPSVPPSTLPPQISLSPPTTTPSYVPPSTLLPSTLPPSALPPSTLPPSTLPSSTLVPSTLPPTTLPPSTTMPPPAFPPPTLPAALNDRYDYPTSPDIVIHPPSSPTSPDLLVFDPPPLPPPPITISVAISPSSFESPSTYPSSPSTSTSSPSSLALSSPPTALSPTTTSPPDLSLFSPSSPSTSTTTTTTTTTTSTTSTTSTTTTSSLSSSEPATPSPSVIAPTDLKPLSSSSPSPPTSSPSPSSPSPSTSTSTFTSLTNLITKSLKMEKKKKKRKLYVMEISNASLFNEIIISSSMFSSHMPNHYDNVLEKCLQQMKERQATATNLSM